MVIITTLIILFALFAFNPLLGSGNPILVLLPAAGVKSDGSDLRANGCAVTRAVSDRSALHRSIVLLQRSVDSRGFVAPYIAAWLQTNYGLGAVGLYLAAMAA